MHYLYRITNQLNGKVYIGQSNKETERWRQHKYFVRREKPRQYIHRAMAKYGVENFVYEVIAMCKTLEDADELEIQLIVRYDSRNKEKGYNISPGADLVWNRGLPKEQQPMYGKKQSVYQKQRVSETHAGIKGTPHTKEWKVNISKIMTGRVLTEEWKEKIAEGNRGKIVSVDSKMKMSESAKGKIITSETRIKMSQSMRGKFSGEKSYAAKLTWELVAQIRLEYSWGEISLSELAKKYGISRSAIHAIIRNRSWKIS